MIFILHLTSMYFTTYLVLPWILVMPNAANYALMWMLLKNIFRISLTYYLKWHYKVKAPSWLCHVHSVIVHLPSDLSILTSPAVRPDKKLPNVYKSYPKMISLGKWMILTRLQKLPNNVGNLGKIIVVTGFEWLP